MLEEHVQVEPDAKHMFQRSLGTHSAGMVTGDVHRLVDETCRSDGPVFFRYGECEEPPVGVRRDGIDDEDPTYGAFFGALQLIMESRPGCEPNVCQCDKPGKVLDS